MFWYVLFWFSVVWLMYIYIGYPVCLWLLSFVVRFRCKPKADYQPQVTVLFSAKDEIDALPNKMANLRALNYPKDRLQIMAVSDGSSDGTADYLSAQPDVETVVLEESVGKNVALNHLLPKVTGEILFFTDANTFFDRSAIRETVKLFGDKRVGAVTGELRYLGLGPRDSVSRGTGLYWWYENKIKLLESRIGSVLVGAGPLLAVRRDRCAELYPDVANDFQQPMQVAATGDAVLYSPLFYGSERAASKMQDEFRRTVRIVARGVCGCRRLWLTVLVRPHRFWQLLSHKIMRWLILPVMALLLLSNLALVQASPSLFYSTVLRLQYAYYGAAAAGYVLYLFEMRAGPLYFPFHFLMLNVAAVAGILRGLFVGGPSVWNKPSSARDRPHGQSEQQKTRRKRGIH